MEVNFYIYVCRNRDYPEFYEGKQNINIFSINENIFYPIKYYVIKTCSCQADLLSNIYACT